MFDSKYVISMFIIMLLLGPVPKMLESALTMNDSYVLNNVDTTIPIKKEIPIRIIIDNRDNTGGVFNYKKIFVEYLRFTFYVDDQAVSTFYVKITTKELVDNGTAHIYPTLIAYASDAFNYYTINSYKILSNNYTIDYIVNNPDKFVLIYQSGGVPLYTYNLNDLFYLSYITAPAPGYYSNDNKIALLNMTNTLNNNFVENVYVYKSKCYVHYKPNVKLSRLTTNNVIFELDGTAKFDCENTPNSIEMKIDLFGVSTSYSNDTGLVFTDKAINLPIDLRYYDRITLYSSVNVTNVYTIDNTTYVNYQYAFFIKEMKDNSFSISKIISTLFDFLKFIYTPYSTGYDVIDYFLMFIYSIVSIYVTAFVLYTITKLISNVKPI